MLTQFDAEPIDVLAVYQKGKENICIYKIRWNNRAHSITTIGYHHKVKSGSTLLHVFHVSNNSLVLN